MTFPTWAKEYLRTRYPKAFHWEQQGPASVCIIDFMQFVKHIPDTVVTLHDLITHFVGKIKYILTRNDGIMKVVVMVDRDSPVVKQIVTHPTRYRNKDVFDHASGDSYLPNDPGAPIPKPWIRFAGSGKLLQRELYPRLFNAFMRGDLIRPGPGQMIILHGFPGRTATVHARQPAPWETGSVLNETVRQVRLWTNDELPITEAAERRDPDLYNRIFYVHYIAPCPEIPQGVIRKCEWVEARNSIQEADVAIAYYNRLFPDENQRICINDGDAFSILLLYASERVLGNNQFRNFQFLALPNKQSKKKKIKKNRDPDDDDDDDDDDENKYHPVLYVDIQQLYCDIMSDKDMGRAGVQNHVLTTVFMFVLAETDFFANYVKGISARNGVWPVFRRKLDMFSHVVQMAKGVEPGWNTPRAIALDEDAFIQFIDYCYLQKYGKSVRRKRGKRRAGDDDDDDDVVTYTALEARTKVDGKGAPKADAEYHLAPRNKKRRWARQVLWNLLYWKNTVFGQQHSPDPFERWQGLSYFGYERAPPEDGEEAPGKPVLAERVSARQKPVDQVFARHLFRNKEEWRARKRAAAAATETGRKVVVNKQRNIVNAFADVAVLAGARGARDDDNEQ